VRTLAPFPLLVALPFVACSSREDPAKQGNAAGAGTGAMASGGTAGKGASGGAGGTGGTSSSKGGSAGSGESGGAGAAAERGGRAGSAGSGNASGADPGGRGGGSGKGSGGSTGGAATGGGGGAGDAGNSGGAGDTGSAGASPSDGCESVSKPERGHYTIRVGGTERGYYLIPSTSSDPVPLVFEFHGRGGDGQGIVSSFGLETSLAGAAVLVAPDGLDQGGGTGWGNGNDSEDIALVKALIERMKADHCVDSARIYALGFSWGGWMATQTGCALGGALAGFVSVEGGGPMGNSCAGPVAGMVVHGTADTAEPIASGIATRDAFRTIDGCGDTLGASPVSGCEQYPSCTKPLLWCQHDGAHLIPDFVIAGLPSFFALTP